MSVGTAFRRSGRGVFLPVRKQLGVSGVCWAGAVAGGCFFRPGPLSPAGWSPAAHRSAWWHPGRVAILSGVPGAAAPGLDPPVALLRGLELRRRVLVQPPDVLEQGWLVVLDRHGVVHPSSVVRRAVPGQLCSASKVITTEAAGIMSRTEFSSIKSVG